MIPIAGSAYTYSYATMGELVAWIIGWDLILEYLVAASAAVSVGWSGYVVAFLHDTFGVDLSKAWTSAPVLLEREAAALRAPRARSSTSRRCSSSLAVTALLVRGVKESARFNTIIVFMKVVGRPALHRLRAALREHRRTGTPSSRRTRASSATSASSASCRARPWSSSPTSASTPSRRRRRRRKNPQRDLPIGILGSLAICTVLYIAVSLILTGVVPYTQAQRPAPDRGRRRGHRAALAGRPRSRSAPSPGCRRCMLVMLLGQPRIFFVDGATTGCFPQVAAQGPPALRHALRHDHHHRRRLRHRRGPLADRHPRAS